MSESVNDHTASAMVRTVALRRVRDARVVRRSGPV